MAEPRLRVLVIGCGIAGLTAAIHAWRRGHQVTVVTKTDDPGESNSSYAQGGIVFRGVGDSPELLVKDIMGASDGMALPEAARIVAEEGPEALQEVLLDWAKVPFERDRRGELLFGEEAAHSKRRVLYSADQTGRAITKALLSFLRRKTGVKLLANEVAIEIINVPHHSRNPIDVYRRPFCLGAYLYHTLVHKVRPVFADRVVLATGGIGQIYRHTTNPEVATGDGVALAWRAGCRVINMEYTQFHPTTLAMPGSGNFLISEAVRGEGAILLDHAGRDFTKAYDRRGSLAPRDTVSRAIFTELEQSGRDHVLLSLDRIPTAVIRKRFPNILQKCRDFKIDITREPIPVTPAFHFSCGGILTDMDGQTTLPNLYAVGECACTGLHGANRLASTSLLEGVVFGRRIAAHLSRLDFRARPFEKFIQGWEDHGLHSSHDPVLVRQDWVTLKNTMWNYVGILRTRSRMKRALETLKDLKNQVDHFYWNVKVHREMLELRNAIQAALLITNSALKNRVSRGCHTVLRERS
jgi:L-aspartate oxidase